MSISEYISAPQSHPATALIKLITFLHLVSKCFMCVFHVYVLSNHIPMYLN